ncbi:GntR family transcriptional regulator [Rhodococcus opacus]|uniref:GntR family transcriptional regulator n=1 Tax=Rhodococcus opacus TaxID=37919 RepID=UPI002476B60E|nr:GntR family transcriptional regulator [Rhodococcus opacus]MDH6293185.1 DNA-binding GntR family transcriptional regulator [Rhodococcus opacus]
MFLEHQGGYSVVTSEHPHHTTSSVSLPTSLKKVATHELRRRIFAGHLRPGVKIDQDALAAELGISKLPIREAVSALEGEGFINIAPRRGAYVASLSPEDIRDQYWMLGEISGLAAERATQNLSKTDFSTLQQLATAMESSESDDEQEQLHFEFHRVINIAAQSSRLTSVLRVLGSAIPRGFAEFDATSAERTHREHRKILKLLKTGKGSQARTAVEDHFARQAEQTVAMLTERGFWADV